jgi:hypothetical protein
LPSIFERKKVTWVGRNCHFSDEKGKLANQRRAPLTLLLLSNYPASDAAELQRRASQADKYYLHKLAR